MLPSGLSAQNGSLKGRVKDGSEPLPGVTIALPGLSSGTVTDVNGFYELRRIPEGTHLVVFSAVGYVTEQRNVVVANGKATDLQIQLRSETIVMQEVEVLGKRGQDKSDTRTSVIDISPQTAKATPGAVEDVLRALQTMPGVLAPNDFSSQLVVRGSGPDQNLIIIDDVEIFNPYRLYGLVSMFNPIAVADVNLVTGGFPARYGDRLSAVLEVVNKEGVRNRPVAGLVNASIVDANVLLEGKNPFSVPGSWLINSRRTYYDLIIEPFVKNAGLVEENVTFPNFYDFQAKLVFGPMKGHKFSFLGIFSADGVNVVSGSKRRTPDSVSVDNTTRNNMVSGSWTFAPHSRLFNKIIYSYYINDGAADFNSKVLDPSLNRERFENSLADTLAPYLLGFRFNSVFTFKKSTLEDKFTYNWKYGLLEAGAAVDWLETKIDFKFDLDPELKAFFAANPLARNSFNNLADIKNYNRSRAYLQNTFNLGNTLYLQPGLRYDYYDILDKAYVAPRVSLSYALNDLTTIRAAWGIFYQSPGYEKLRDQNILFNFDRAYTAPLQAEKAIHYVAGVERWLTPEWSLKAEAYYKDFRNLIVQKMVKGTVFYTEPIPGRDLKLASSWTPPVGIPGDSITQIPVNNATGESYGFELLLAKRNLSQGARLNGWLSYAWAVADRFQGAQKTPFRFDQRHTVNLVMNYKLSDSWDMGVKFQYGSGFPDAFPVGVKPRVVLVDANGDKIPETPVIGVRRSVSDPAKSETIFDIQFAGREMYDGYKPAYHRLDVRFTHYTKFWGWNWTFYLDVINVYNHTNILNYDYFVADDLSVGKEVNAMFPILPTFGLSVTF